MKRNQKFVEVFEYVIVTVPLGVWKSEMIQFVPELPVQKQNSIENIGFGSVGKIGEEL